MRFAEINPRYRYLLDALDLRTPEQFLALPSIVIGGHPERNVARTALGSLQAYLKREHRVRWRDRFASWLAGFGFVTKSQREAMTLRALERVRIGCPDWIACGEDGHGRAFLLVRALTNAVELRRFLDDRRGDDGPRARRAIACRIGIALARMHDAGFDHPDLCSKHVFVSDDGTSIYFVDWQRSRRGPVDERRRIRDLAALDATLAEELASGRERWACARAYHAHRAGSVGARCSVLAASCKSLARAVRRRARGLLHERHRREARRPVSDEPQELIWLDGEALCITPRFLEELRGRVPDWLRMDGAAGCRGETVLSFVTLPSGRPGFLVRGRRNQPLRWAWAELRGKRLTTPEVRQAGVLFRRQGRGQSAPRLLAFGQRCSPWQSESFLLTEVPTAENGRAP